MIDENEDLFDNILGGYNEALTTPIEKTAISVAFTLNNYASIQNYDYKSFTRDCGLYGIYLPVKDKNNPNVWVIGNLKDSEVSDVTTMLSSINAVFSRTDNVAGMKGVYARADSLVEKMASLGIMERAKDEIEAKHIQDILEQARLDGASRREARKEALLSANRDGFKEQVDKISNSIKKGRAAGGSKNTGKKTPETPETTATKDGNSGTVGGEGDTELQPNLKLEKDEEI